MNAIQNNEKLACHVDNRPLQESHLAFRKARHLKETKTIPTCQVDTWGFLMNAIQNNEKLARHVDNRPIRESHLAFRKERHSKRKKYSPLA